MGLSSLPTFTWLVRGGSRIGVCQFQGQPSLNFYDMSIELHLIPYSWLQSFFYYDKRKLSNKRDPVLGTVFCKIGLFLVNTCWLIDPFIFMKYVSSPLRISSVLVYSLIITEPSSFLITVALCILSFHFSCSCVFIIKMETGFSISHGRC